MKNRLAIVISIAVLALGGSLYALAGTQAKGGQQGAAGARPHGDRAHLQRFFTHLAEQLGLSDGQKAEIQSILAAERPTVEPLFHQLAQNRQALRAAAKDGKFDEAQVRALAAQQGQTLADLIVAKQRVQSKVYNVLTPEQRAKAEQMRERFESRARRHFAE